VFRFARNSCSDCSGIGVHVAPEWVFRLARNTHFITAAALAVGLALRKLVDRFLDEDDPRRQLIAQALLYGGTFIVIAVSLWFRHRG
jgi:hypothetical protein